MITIVFKLARQLKFKRATKLYRDKSEGFVIKKKSYTSSVQLVSALAASYSSQKTDNSNLVKEFL